MGKTIRPKRMRRFCFTLNNPTEAHYIMLRRYTELSGSPRKIVGIGYIVYQTEKAPTTGTVHIQGYIEMDIARTIQAIKKKIFRKLANEVHIESTNGSGAQNRAYCYQYSLFDV